MVRKAPVDLSCLAAVAPKPRDVERALETRLRNWDEQNWEAVFDAAELLARFFPSTAKRAAERLRASRALPEGEEAAPDWLIILGTLGDFDVIEGCESGAWDPLPRSDDIESRFARWLAARLKSVPAADGKKWLALLRDPGLRDSMLKHRHLRPLLPELLRRGAKAPPKAERLLGGPDRLTAMANNRTRLKGLPAVKLSAELIPALRKEAASWWRPWVWSWPRPISAEQLHPGLETRRAQLAAVLPDRGAQVLKALRQETRDAVIKEALDAALLLNRALGTEGADEFSAEKLLCAASLMPKEFRKVIEARVQRDAYFRGFLPSVRQWALPT